ncbi:MAG: response regulator transcription factor [Bacteroidota bacterium]
MRLKHGKFEFKYYIWHKNTLYHFSGMENNIISVLIVEDEEIWTRTLQLILADFGFSVVKAVSTVEDALEAFGSCEYDIILMDIHLNGKSSGIELAKIVRKLYNKPFIFITASKEHSVMQAAESQPSAYLPKPINPSSLFIAIQNAINNFNNNETAGQSKEDESFSSFFIKQGNRYKKIDWKDVSFLSAGKNYVSVYNTIDKTEYYIRSSLQKTLQHIIPRQLQKQFIQVNRSEAVQLSYIQEFVNDEVKTSFKSFPVSESYSKELRQKLNIVS